MGITSCWQRCVAFGFKQENHFLYYCDIGALAQASRPLPDGLTVHICDRHNVDELLAIASPLPPIIANRIEKGDIAFIAMHGAKWVFRSSVVIGPQCHQVTGYPLHLGEHDAYLECAETAPELRGKGIAPAMMGVTMQALLARGYRRAFLTIALSNTASCRAAEKGGAQRIGLLFARRLIGHWHASYIPLTDDRQFVSVTQGEGESKVVHQREVIGQK